MIEPKTMAGPVGEDSYTRHNDITLQEGNPWTFQVVLLRFKYNDSLLRTFFYLSSK